MHVAWSMCLWMFVFVCGVAFANVFANVFKPALSRRVIHHHLWSYTHVLVKTAQYGLLHVYPAPQPVNSLLLM